MNFHEFPMNFNSEKSDQQHCRRHGPQKAAEDGSAHACDASTLGEDAGARGQKDINGFFGYFNGVYRMFTDVSIVANFWTFLQIFRLMLHVLLLLYLSTCMCVCTHIYIYIYTMYIYRSKYWM